MLITVSCDEHVEEAGGDEVEEFVDKLRTTNGYIVRCVAIDFPAIFDEMWFFRILGIFLVNFLYQIGGALIGHARKSDDTQPVHQKEQPGH